MFFVAFLFTFDAKNGKTKVANVLLFKLMMQNFAFSQIKKVLKRWKHFCLTQFEFDSS